MLYTELLSFLSCMDVSANLAALAQEPLITDWVTAYGTIGTLIGAVLIGALSLYLTRKVERTQRLAEIFKLLDDNGHRNARRRNYNLYLETDPIRIDKILDLMGVDIRRKNANIRESKEIVKADFDQAAYLALNGAISKDDFLDMYGLEVIKSWKVLCEDVDHIRKSSGDSKYMINFEKLKNAAEVHKNTTVEDVKITKDVTISPVVLKTEHIFATPKYEIRIIFDRPMNIPTLSNKITLKDSQNRSIPGRVSWNSNHSAVFETELTNLTTSEFHTLSVNKQIEDNTGSRMEQDYYEQFPFSYS